MASPKRLTNMLQSIREKTSGWIASIVLGLIILTMAFFGMESYLTADVPTYAAKIERAPAWWPTAPKFWPVSALWSKDEITQDEFRKRFDQVRQMQRQQQGESFNPAEFEKVENKRIVLDQMIDEALMKMVSEREGIVIPDSIVQKSIMDNEAFHGPDGKFDVNQYQLVLNMQQLTPKQVEALVRADIIQEMLPKQIAASAFASESELDTFLRLNDQTRDLRLLEIPPPSMPALPPTEAEIKAWYDAHATQYQTKETVTVEYVELDASTLPVSVTASDEALKKLYVEQKERYGTEDQRVASHILVQVAENAPAAASDAALAKARDIAAKARLPGADFAALARQYSDDIGSKDAGGDLGPVSKGVFGDAFDAALAALQRGQVSDPVRLSDGWHVVQFRDIVPGTQKPFESVRAELESQYLESERERAFNDLQTKLVDAIYADPRQLATTAQKLKLPVTRTAPFSLDQGEGIAALEPVRKAAFNSSQKVERLVSDPVEVAPNHVVVLHVVDYKPVTAIPLASIRDRVMSDLAGDRLIKAAKVQADALLGRARKGEGLDTLATEVSRTVAVVPKATRQPPSPQLAALFTEAFRLPRPAAGKTEIGLAKLAPDRYALVEVTAVTDGDPKVVTADIRKTLVEQLGKLRGDVERRAYIQAQRKRFSIDIAEDRL